MKSGGAHVSTSCYLNPGLLYTMHTLWFHMILMHDQQREREKEREIPVPGYNNYLLVTAREPVFLLQQEREGEIYK